MTRSFVWLDVFTDRPYSGNPLAVFPDAVGLTDVQMATIARELNLSETTFVFPPEDGTATHRVRIMTPTRELPFAGHPTVGTAIALATLAGGPGEKVAADYVFALQAGPTAVSVHTLVSGTMEASFVAPKTPVLGVAPVTADELAHRLGLDRSDLDDTVPPHLTDSGGTVFLTAVVTSLEALRRASLVGSIGDIVGVYVAYRTDSGWQARMFAPAAGVVEDPATGSATCSFAGTLHAYVESFSADGTYDVSLRQGVEMGRPSELSLSFDVSDGEICEVRLRGGAVVVLHGEIEEPTR